ncbi:hypothetical protein Q8F55_004961 [Vanrija albida]|uniref:Phospholipid-transporting ATPase n=1 Tax=Vanrija albida TaxID=181172 RepID=A0ABR3Q119_9TREE
MPGSTSGAPLVAHRKRHKKDSWWSRNVSKPMEKLNPTRLFSRTPVLGVQRTLYFGEGLPADYFDKKGRVLKSKKFCTNQVVTSKYTIITFLPRNLLEQFRRVANIFFLAINILQFFPKFATISPGLVILPLIVVLGITAIKDGYEDFKRHQADHFINQSIVHVLGGEGYENVNPSGSKEKTFIKGIPLPGRRSKKSKAKDEDDDSSQTRPTGENLQRLRSQVTNWDDDDEAADSPNELGWHRTMWEDVKVGDFVKIYDHEQIPADIIVCATSEEEDICYIETKNLDGETNLKSRHGVSGLNVLDSAAACASIHMRVELDAPEVNMYRLNGSVTIQHGTLGQGIGQEPEVHPITLDTTLLRGCVLRNTAWVIGFVAYTGTDSKIVQNSGRAPSKRSKVERQMNPQVLFNLVVLGVIGIVCAIVDHFNEKRWERENTYWTLFYHKGDNPDINGLITFFNALITFQNIIPISLYISIEFVRTIQALFIFWDHDIRYFKGGVKYRTLARTWNLSDDLGQIEYIFSDKTGTLTQNVMIFRQCSVGGKIYYGEAPAPRPSMDPKKLYELKKTITGSDNSADDELKKKTEAEREIPPFHDAELDADLGDQDSEQSRLLHGFFAVLGLCHTALASENEDGVIEYKSQSPDETALVQAAADVGFVFLGRDKNLLKLKTPFSDEPDEYELLNVLEFNSARKRMSVVVRKLDEHGRIFLLTKGADNVIFERLSTEVGQQKIKDQTDKDLQVFANEGLRTLCLAYRVLDDGEYEEWAQDYHDAEVSLHDRENRIDEVSARLEKNLTLLGSTAIEDKLQDGVPETIADLKRAGIKVWVATGDKLETAVAIGYTTNLLTADSNLIIVRDGNHSIYDQLRGALEGFFGDDSLTRQPTHTLDHTFTRQSTQLQRVNTGAASLVGEDNGQRPGGFSLVIDGHALTQCFEDEDTSDLLLALAVKCNTVICCRVSPLQKAQIVSLIKDNLGVMTLAIGDGANDVSMIQTAHVGVGISGEEGLQAVNSSDFAVAQFRFLKRLLLVHGHWSYFRNATMICNFFYKNIVGMGVLFWFMIYCGWSTTYVYAYVYLLFWNVFWTIAPVIGIGVFERNIDDDILMALPELYRYSRSGKYYNWPRFLYYMFEGVYQTAVVYFILCYAYDTTSTRGDGYEVFKDEMSTTMAIGAVMIANLFSGLNIDAWSWWVVFGVWIGPVLIWLFTAIYSVIKPSMFWTGVYGNDVFLFRSAAFWFGWPFVIVFSLMPRYLIKYAKQNIFPNDIDIMRLVRKYHPEANPFTDPMLGGKLNVDRGEESPFAHAGSRPTTPVQVDQHDKNNIGLQTFSSPGGDRPTAMRPSVDIGRPSYDSRRSFDSGRRPSMQYGANRHARGSAHDMSTGLTREASRGFDFTMEEGGVAVHRMQSRLSEASAHRRKYTLRRLGMQNRAKETERDPSAPASPSNNPFARVIRERAGSILRGNRNRSSTVNTRNSRALSEGLSDHAPTSPQLHPQHHP